jgi:hypothetical protein
MESMEYIRETYRVPAKVGMHVIANGQKGVIVGARRQYLLIRIDGRTDILSFHPTWEMKYLENNECQ